MPGPALFEERLFEAAARLGFAADFGVDFDCALAKAVPIELYRYLPEHEGPEDGKRPLKAQKLPFAVRLDSEAGNIITGFHLG